MKINFFKLKKRDKTSFFLFILILFVFIFWGDSPRKFYNIIKLDYDQRLTKVYGYCEGHYTGFLRYLDKKYKFEKKPNIIQYVGARNPGWIFHQRNKKDLSNNYKIFLGYNNIDNIKLPKIDKNRFKYNFSYAFNHRYFKNIIIKDKINTSNIKRIYLEKNGTSISSFLPQKKIIGINGHIVIPVAEEIKNILYENRFNEQDFSFKIDFVNRETQIHHLEVNFENIYKVENMKIVEQYENCLLVKND